MPEDGPITFRSQSAMARGLGVNRNSIVAWVGKPDFPGGRTGPWSLHEIVPWLIARQKQKAPLDDPLLDGPDSPALERYRDARASLSELELEQRRGRLVDVDELGDWWANEIAAPLRRATETLQTRFGVEAAEIVTRALERADDVVGERRASA
jgi:hypothetical protein